MTEYIEREASCKDCSHFPVCEDKLFGSNHKNCRHFQNKAEAIKEFAERFMQKAEKTKIIYIADTTIQEQEAGWYQISVADFDNLVKEMVGADNV